MSEEPTVTLNAFYSNRQLDPRGGGVGGGDEHRDNL